jgi:hypothetical protein
MHKGLPRPWFGYLFVLRDCDTVKRPQRDAPKSRHFRPDVPFHKASYQRRYELLCERLVASDLYQSACFMMSEQEGETIVEPNDKLAFGKFGEAACGAISPATK